VVFYGGRRLSFLFRVLSAELHGLRREPERTPADFFTLSVASAIKGSFSRGVFREFGHALPQRQRKKSFDYHSRIIDAKKIAYPLIRNHWVFCFCLFSPSISWRTRQIFLPIRDLIGRKAVPAGDSARLLGRLRGHVILGDYVAQLLKQL
jgi:hypothetical protein